MNASVFITLQMWQMSQTKTTTLMETSINKTDYPLHAFFPLAILKILLGKKMSLHCRPREIQKKLATFITNMIKMTV